MTDQQSNSAVESRLDALADEIYADLAARFPVCLASDEFHFFPHYRAARHIWSRWDDFSEAGIQACLGNISQWQKQIEHLKSSGPSFSEEADLDLLTRALTTLDEQLRYVCLQKTQPTFYLTMISIGLAEALEDSRDAFEQRVRTLDGLLDSAMANLSRIPVLYRDLALEMLPGLRAWASGLALADGNRRNIDAAFGRFGDHLRRAVVDPDFRLGKELYEHILDYHIGCRMGLDELVWYLDQEIEAALDLLSASASRISPEKPWQSVFRSLPPPAPINNDVVALYGTGIEQLKRHGLEAGYLTTEAVTGCEVEIEIIPEHLRPVRADAAYSMPPGHPPKGGVFFILPQDRHTIPRDMMLLVAHETYPGHHLLDTQRLRHQRSLRRYLEFPLFYEGWASFSEEILFDTGFFSGPADRLLSAKRRFWRACRGRADLNIHTGRWRLQEAALELGATGLVNLETATAMVRRYALKPGYQLSYSIGRQKFGQIYTDYLHRGGTPARFVRDAVSHGEIGFDFLAERLLG